MRQTPGVMPPVWCPVQTGSGLRNNGPGPVFIAVSRHGKARTCCTDGDQRGILCECKVLTATKRTEFHEENILGKHWSAPESGEFGSDY